MSPSCGILHGIASHHTHGTFHRVHDYSKMQISFLAFFCKKTLLKACYGTLDMIKLLDRRHDVNCANKYPFLHNFLTISWIFFFSSTSSVYSYFFIFSSYLIQNSIELIVNTHKNHVMKKCHHDPINYPSKPYVVKDLCFVILFAFSVCLTCM